MSLRELMIARLRDIEANPGKYACNLGGLIKKGPRAGRMSVVASIRNDYEQMTDHELLETFQIFIMCGFRQR